MQTIEAKSQTLSKHERIEKACAECIPVKIEEEQIRSQSESRQKEKIEEITNKYNVDARYVMKLIKNTKKGRVYGF